MTHTSRLNLLMAIVISRYTPPSGRALKKDIVADISFAGEIICWTVMIFYHSVVVYTSKTSIKALSPEDLLVNSSHYRCQWPIIFRKSLNCLFYLSLSVAGTRTWPMRLYTLINILTLRLWGSPLPPPYLIRPLCKLLDNSIPHRAAPLHEYILSKRNLVSL